MADDDTGHFYRDDLLSHGVSSNIANEVLESGKTGKCLVLITQDADRTMNTFLGITGDIGSEQIDESALIASEYLYVEGYLASSPTALAAVTQAKALALANNVKFAFSLSDPNMVKFCREGLDDIIGEKVDILFCNSDEAFMYTECESLEDAQAVLLTKADMVVITLGAEGALIVTNSQQIKVDGHKVEAIDSNGAGDLFAGSFLYAITRGMSVQQAGKLACFASAQLVTEFGPRLSKAGLDKVKSFVNKLVA